MDNYISKFTFFDIMAMLIPGGVIIAMIALSLGYKLSCNTEDNINTILVITYIFVLCYLVGLVHNTIMDYIGNKIHFRNNPRRIYTTLKKFQDRDYSYLKELTKDIIKSKEEQHILDKYYEAYYYVERHSNNNHIHIIETQVIFIRNMLLPLFLLFLFHFDAFSDDIGINNPYIKCPFIIGTISLFLPLISRQKKIYELVWEDYEFLKRLENNEKSIY